MGIDIISDEINEIFFERKPIPVPYNYRIIYKLSQIVLIINLSNRTGNCSVLKLHVLSSALSSDEEMSRLVYFLENKVLVKYPFIRMEPALNRAINYGLAEGIINQRNDGKIFVTNKGENLYNCLMEDLEIMVRDKEFLSKFGKKVTDKFLSIK
ncbi:hypothetical protein HZI73_10745 [Vallitalea pronyensis]|uniref:Uncharacterized protein n=1 Tax=Vallitalea pronyensis TaxID=1348613 RepID=A0A8J8SGW2_9FIRM|nr:hypothetical protein [Vallitalea pronyensis]QUI22738.1 hypothetical protein HZI73_10745 [Vallitalea pronyensis]